MRYRLAALDIDGTLVGPSGRPTAAVVEAVRGIAARGVIVAAATARPYEIAIPALEPIAEALTAVIAAAGADIRTTEGEVIAQRPLPPEAARALARLCDEQGWRAMAGTAAGAFRRRPVPEALGPAEAVANLAEVPLDEACTIALFTNLHDPALPALEAIVRREGLRAEPTLSSSGREIISVTHGEADKGRGLRRLCEALGLAPAEAVAFGDTEVDLPLIEAAGYGVAMGEAPDALKAAADLVTGSVAEDGVATAIKRIWGRD